MLESQSMVALLASASADYDLIIIDTAPLLLVADAMPLLRSVSGVLAVASVGHTKRDALEFLGSLSCERWTPLCSGSWPTACSRRPVATDTDTATGARIRTRHMWCCSNPSPSQRRPVRDRRCRTPSDRATV